MNESFLNQVKENRITNYNMLYNSLSKIGITPIKKITNQEIVPQNLAIIDEKGYLNEYLRKKRDRFI